MSKIPVYIMEEHHEAFYYWNYFIECGLIPPKHNYLLHIDHHDDMEAGGYDWDFRIPWESLEQIRTFTYEKLGIADFITPALYQGIFDTVHIMKNLLPKPCTEMEFFVQRVGKGHLRQGKYIPFVHSGYKREKNPDYSFYTLRENGLNDWTERERSVVLDLDLDYFCWDDSLSTAGVKQMEITREAYEEYWENLYHPFRILPKRLMQAKEKDGRYYLEYREFVKPDAKPDKERIKNRINHLLDWLETEKIKIAVVDICRSRYSGYLNNEIFPWVEEKYLKKLGERTDYVRREIGRNEDNK